MRANQVLERLHGVKQKSENQWVACCPAHDDRSPSLSIKLNDDRILMHCFGGCHIDVVLAAIGLSVSDLFDRPLAHKKSPVSPFERRRAAQAFEALSALRHELMIIMIAADQTASGRALSFDDLVRVHTAHGRIIDALSIVVGQPKAKRPALNDEAFIGEAA